MRLLHITFLVAILVAWITDHAILAGRIRILEIESTEIGQRFAIARGDWRERRRLVADLSDKQDPQSTALLMLCLADPDPGVRADAMDALRKRKNYEVDFGTPDYKDAPTRQRIEELLRIFFARQ